MIGAAKGALDEYEEILRTRKTQRPPIVPRIEDPDYQRWYGLATGKVAAAEAVLLQVAEQWHDACRRSVEDGIPFTREEDLRLNMVAREALTLAWDAMQGRSSGRRARAPRGGGSGSSGSSATCRSAGGTSGRSSAMDRPRVGPASTSGWSTRC